MSSSLKRVILIFGNSMITYGWIRVWLTLLIRMQFTNNQKEDFCNEVLHPLVIQALGLSTIELFNSLVGLSRSSPVMVSIFLVVRNSVEYFCGPSIDGILPFLPSSTGGGSECIHWTHLYTIGCWSIGESIRFGCFTLMEIIPSWSDELKYIRYHVGPIMFPLGALGEMFMISKLALDSNNNYRIWFVMLWPIGFYPLMKQLLRQKYKFLKNQLQQQKQQQQKELSSSSSSSSSSKQTTTMNSTSTVTTVNTVKKDS